MDEGYLHAVERVEVLHHAVRLVVGQPEGRHAEGQPRTYRSGRLHEVEQPVRLDLLALAHQDRGRERRLLRVEAADVAPRALDDVAPGAVVARDQAAAGDDPLVA